MSTISVGEIVTGIGVLVGFIAGVISLYKYFKKAVENVLEDKLTAIAERLDKIEKSNEQRDIDACKDFLARFLSDVERGVAVSETEMQRFSERYDHYIHTLNQNGYIKDKVNKLREKGLL